MAKDEILIRCLNTKTQKVKNLFPSIANNRQLMKNVGCVISDPNYEAKMDAIKNKRPFSENGQAKLPAQESFAPKVAEPVKSEPVPQPKNEMAAPEIAGEPKTRKTRRTKAQMQADKQSNKQTA